MTGKNKITIDAAGKRLGRLASDIAVLLNGKNDPGYMPNRAPDISVEVVNASAMQITEKKKSEKRYVRYTGYPGGLRKQTLADLAEKKGYAEVLRKAVYGMIPSNRLRKVKMKLLSITE